MQREDQVVTEANSVQSALDEASGIAAQQRAKTPLGKLPWRGLVYIVILFAIVLGGMYSGIFTATESAAFGAIAAVIILLFEVRKEGWKGIWDGLTTALQNTADYRHGVFHRHRSGILSSFFIAARVTNMITEAVLSWDMPARLAMLILLLSLIPWAWC